MKRIKAWDDSHSNLPPPNRATAAAPDAAPLPLPLPEPDVPLAADVEREPVEEARVEVEDVAVGDELVLFLRGAKPGRFLASFHVRALEGRDKKKKKNSPTRLLSMSYTEYRLLRKTSPNSHVLLPAICCFCGG